jgi:hypothetical protein
MSILYAAPRRKSTRYHKTGIKNQHEITVKSCKNHENSTQTQHSHATIYNNPGEIPSNPWRKPWEIPRNTRNRDRIPRTK